MTFDVGQCLLGFDPDFLAEKLAEHDVTIDARAAASSMPAAYEAYGEALRNGGHGGGAWKVFVRHVIQGAGATPSEDLLEWLFQDQTHRNLWQKPIPGMIELAREVRAAGIPVGIVSNSEGHLDKLFAKLGYTDDFPVVADSGVLGFEKPGREIFAWAASKLGVSAHEIVHIGDSWAADVVGALGVGARVVWFPKADERELPQRVIAANSASDVRGALVTWGVVS